MEGKAIMVRDEDGNIVKNEHGYISCVSEGGLQFQISLKDIDSVCSTSSPMDSSVYENIETLEPTDSPHENVSFLWTDEMTQLFLSLYKEKIKLLNSGKLKNKKAMWQLIADEMKKKDINLTYIQVENKFKSLERTYKNITRSNRTSKTRYPYEKDLEEILGKKYLIDPLVVSGNKGTVVKRKQSCSESEASDTDQFFHWGQDYEEPQEVYFEKVKREHGIPKRLKQSCQKSIKTLIENIEKEKIRRIESEKRLHDEYRAMRLLHEKDMKRVENQLIISNKLRQERNDLLKQLLNKM